MHTGGMKACSHRPLSVVLGPPLVDPDLVLLPAPPTGHGNAWKVPRGALQCPGEPVRGLPLRCVLRMVRHAAVCPPPTGPPRGNQGGPLPFRATHHQQHGEQGQQALAAAFHHEVCMITLAALLHIVFPRLSSGLEDVAGGRRTRLIQLVRSH